MPNPVFPTVFLPHGAGPCFFMDWPPAGTWDHMAGYLKGVLGQVGARPRAIVVVSGHWEAPAFTVTTDTAPGLVYDYSGFPAHTYQITWPVPGAPELADRIRGLLGDAGLPSAGEHGRGLDHGVFIPMKLVLPGADIPVVQLSLRTGLDPSQHLALGRALAPLRSEGVLLVGSGMTYHNMRGFDRSGGAATPASVAFNAWLAESLALPRSEREARLRDWARAPGGRESHPREEHLLPLHVVAGAAGDDAGVQVLSDTVLGSRQSAFQFGAAVTA